LKIVIHPCDGSFTALSSCHMYMKVKVSMFDIWRSSMRKQSRMKVMSFKSDSTDQLAIVVTH